MKDNKALKYLTLITGVLTLLLGVYTLVRPMRTFLAIGWILGILLFVNGIELVILSLSKEKKEIGGCILGVLEGLAGIILLFSGIQRFITDVMAAYLVGASILVYGIFQIVGGTKVYKTSKIVVDSAVNISINNFDMSIYNDKNLEQKFAAGETVPSGWIVSNTVKIEGQDQFVYSYKGLNKTSNKREYVAYGYKADALVLVQNDTWTAITNLTELKKGVNVK